MSEDTDEYENYGDYDYEDDDDYTLDDSEQFPLINTDDKCAYNVYSVTDDTGVYIPNCINDPYITVNYTGVRTRVDLVFNTTDFGNAELSLESSNLSVLSTYSIPSWELSTTLEKTVPLRILIRIFLSRRS